MRVRVFYLLSWFSVNNLEIAKAENLEIWSIKQLFIRNITAKFCISNSPLVFRYWTKLDGCISDLWISGEFRVPLRSDWPSRHLLYRKMTKKKSKEDLFFSFMKLSNATVTSKQNFIEKSLLYFSFTFLYL